MCSSEFKFRNKKFIYPRLINLNNTISSFQTEFKSLSSFQIDNRNIGSLCLSNTQMYHKDLAGKLLQNSDHFTDSLLLSSCNSCCLLSYNLLVYANTIFFRWQCHRPQNGTQNLEKLLLCPYTFDAHQVTSEVLLHVLIIQIAY